MRKTQILLMLLILSAMPPAQSKQTRPQESLVLNRVTVIDATGAPAEPNMTVVIVGDRITAFGKTGNVAVPKDAQQVDATGKFLIPGLCDMHVHLSISKESSLATFIANGVTSVRDMGGDLQEIDRWRRRIVSGELLGPRIVRAGPFVDGPKKDIPYRLTVTNPAEARAAVRSLQAQGVDFIKVHNLVPREAYFALAQECRQRRIVFVGHLPQGISAEEASNAGQKSIEHTETFIEAAVFEPGSRAKTPEEGLAAYSSKRRKALCARFVKNNTWICPTLVTYRDFAFEADPAFRDDPRQKYLAPEAREFVDKYFPLPPKDAPPEDYTKRRWLFQQLVALVGEMHRAGVGILAGTDGVFRSVIPGFSLHDELELLVRAGLSPLEALQTATRNPAKFLGKLDSSGTIEKGKVADLVLLDADPLQNIRNTQKIHAIVVGGKLISQSGLQAMLVKVEAAVNKK